MLFFIIPLFLDALEFMMEWFCALIESIFLAISSSDLSFISSIPVISYATYFASQYAALLFIIAAVVILIILLIFYVLVIIICPVALVYSWIFVCIPIAGSTLINLIACIMLHNDFPEPPCDTQTLQEENDCKYTIIMHVLSITALYNFIIVLLYHFTSYLVIKYNYDGLIELKVDEEEEATLTRNTEEDST